MCLKCSYCRLEMTLIDFYRDTFIYEYVGDVVNPVSFKKRMRDYAAEGIQHFYFMMLQKDEVRTWNIFVASPPDLNIAV